MLKFAQIFCAAPLPQNTTSYSIGDTRTTKVSVHVRGLEIDWVSIIHYLVY
jgi:hypothetical protein